MSAPVFNTPYLNDYMAMVEETESPRIFHLWAAMFAMSAALGRRCYLPFGVGDIFPNQYVLLIGTPGTRKSSAMNIARKLLRESTGVRFAPSDTGFQRQGLAEALLNKDEEEVNATGSLALSEGTDSVMSLMDLDKALGDSFDAEAELALAQSEHRADKHHLVITASEFSKVIGQNNHSMLDFLGDRYDGDEYSYRTRQTKYTMKETLMNMMACSTPASLANSLPPQANGQGFLSRIILVYGARKYRSIARPDPPSDDLRNPVKEALANAYYSISGSFAETAEAKAHSESLYEVDIGIPDNRFIYYSERRFTHLLKLGMCIAAARGSNIIVKDDYEEAHRILKATERGMPDALGEFGLNPLAMLKQEILEQLRATQGPLTMEQVVTLFHRDARSTEIMEVLTDLIRCKQVIMTQPPNGVKLLSAVFRERNTEDDMMNLLMEK